jgi:hypothetical protein
MTSLSRRNRRTTLRRTIRKATAISLAWLGFAGSAAAQNPGSGWNRPIATSTAPSTVTPIAQTPAKPLDIPQAAPIGTRVMLPGQTPPVTITRVQGAAPKGPDPTPAYRSVEQLNVFKLTNDAEFNSGMLAELNNERLKKWEKEKVDKESTGQRAPEQPKPLTVADLPETVGMPKQGTRAQSRHEPTPLWLKVEPSYVVHRKLFFEDKNAERYGWEIGIAQPAISAAYFAKDVLLWPSHLASSLFERYDTSAGKCPPGSPVPYLLYPPEITAFGGSVGAAAIIGTALLIP